jgi:hypothetical protein
MLFNRSGNGIEEVRKHASFIYHVTEFETMETDLELAHEELKRYVPKELLTMAQEHYDSSDYGTDEALDALVSHLQLPVVLLGYHSYLRNSEVTHTSTGRKVVIDNENEKMPWEWMLKRDEDAIMDKAYKAIDRLLEFLDESDIDEWTESEQYLKRQTMIIRTAKDFSRMFDIGESLRVFTLLVPLMEEVERKTLKPAMGDWYQDLKDNITDPDFADILTYTQLPLALYTMALAFRRISDDVLPDKYLGSYQMRSVRSDTSNITQRREVSRILEQEADKEFSRLQQIIRVLDGEAEPEDLRSADDKFFMP